MLDLAAFERDVLGEPLYVETVPTLNDLMYTGGDMHRFDPNKDKFVFDVPDDDETHTEEIAKEENVIELIPKQEEATQLLQSQKYNFILYGGAIRGGKTVWGLCMLLMMCEIFPNSRWVVIRKNSERIRKTTIPSFEALGASGTLRRSPFEYQHPNGSIIMFMGENFERDPELDSFKGLEANGFLFEEINECQHKTFKKAIERAGTWKHVKSKTKPKPCILGTCNPTQGWVKDEFYTPWTLGTLKKQWAYVPALADENPHIDEEVKENWKLLPWYEYEVFVKGNWDLQILAENAFFHAFDFEVHVKPTIVNLDWSLFVSIDSNVLPYCTATIWQFNNEHRIIRQVGEVCAKSPHNWAGGLALQLKKWLNEYWRQKTVYITGDGTTKNQNTLDQNKSSFFDIFKRELGNDYNVIGRIKAPNPSVPLTAEFTNALLSGWSGWTVEIGEHCKESVTDYMLVQKAEDNTMLKKKVKDEHGNSFEPNGHLSDTFRYVLYSVLKGTFNEWKRRNSGDTSGVVGSSRVGNYED